VIIEVVATGLAGPLRIMGMTYWLEKAEADVRELG
jgi:hypothetical protein